MIEQVWGGGGDVPGGCAAFLSQFFRASVFVSDIFNSPMPIWVDFTNICIFLLYIMCITSKSQTVF